MSAQSPSAKSISKIPEKSEVLFSAKEVDLLVAKLAEEIGAALAQSQRPSIFICVLKGAWIFMADLVRKIPHPVQVDFLRASSYGEGTKSSGLVKVDIPFSLSVKDKDVYILDEIIDTGRTLLELKNTFINKGAASVKLVALLDKKSRREVDIEPDFVGLEIPDVFVVGYGLDWSERYRDLPDIHAIVS